MGRKTKDLDHKSVGRGLPMVLIQSLSFIILALLLVFDKGFGWMVNPPSDYFYLVAGTIAAMGQTGISLIDKYLERKK